MNTKRLGIVVTLMLMLGLFGMAHAQMKIGYVDSQRIISSLPSAVDAQKKLETEANKWGEELQRMNEELRTLQEQLEQQSLLLSDEKKQEKAEELQALYVRAQQYQAQKYGDGGEFFTRRDELMGPVFDEINVAIHKIGDDEGYDFIFDAVAGNIVHAKEDHDVTDKVLKELGVDTSAGK